MPTSSRYAARLRASDCVCNRLQAGIDGFYIAVALARPVRTFAKRAGAPSDAPARGYGLTRHLALYGFGEAHAPEMGPRDSQGGRAGDPPAPEVKGSDAIADARLPEAQERANGDGPGGENDARAAVRGRSGTSAPVSMPSRRS